MQVAVETQGTIWNDWLAYVDMLTVSPKPPSSGNMTPLGTTKAFLEHYPMITPTHQTVLKCVVFDEEDYKYARAVHGMFPDYPFYLSVGTYMGGLQGDFAGGAIDNRLDILDRYHWLIDRTLLDENMKEAIIFPQLHALVWGHERGH
jgi:7-carboxy-7-deazaguanine synthase